MKKAIYIGIAAIFAIAILFTLQSKPEITAAYHIALADPKLYTGGVFTDTFKIQKGTYQFSFIPNGDSPQMLSISLKGTVFSYAENFTLQGTLHNTGISTYYTWDYVGNKVVDVPDDQDVQITINPNGNTVGSISIYLIKI